jgi:hypothetical protein
MNLVDMIGKYVSPDLMSKVGSAAGLGSDETKKVASGAVPLVAAGLARMGSSEQGAGRLLDLARQSGAEDMVERFGDAVGDETSRRSLVERGGGLLSSLFGAKSEGVLDAFSAQTGASRTGTRSFLAMLAPLALGILGRQARSQGLGAGGLASMLSGQAGLLTNMLPGGVGKLLGGVMPGRDEREPPHMEAERPREVPIPARTYEPARTGQEVGARRWVLPAVLGLIALAFVAWAFLRQRPSDVERQARRPAPSATRPADPGVQRQAPPRGIDVLASLPSGNLAGQRFTFGEVRIEEGTRKLAPESAQQTERLAAVMKERPGMKVRLEGERAGAVRDHLAARGIEGERVSTAATRSGEAASGGTAAGGQAQLAIVDVVVTGQ